MDENVETAPAEEANAIGDASERPVLTVLLAVVVGVAYVVVQAAVVLGLLVLELARDPGLDVDAWADQAESNGTVLAVATCLASLVTVPLIIGLVALLVRRQQRPAPIREFLWLHWPGAKSLALWIAAVIGYVFAADWFTALLGHEMTSDYLIEAYLSAGSVSLLWAALVIAAPLSEELLFRGFLFRGLMSTRLGRVGAAIITSLAWALIHIPYDWHVIAVIFVGGLLLAAARQSTQSVVTCILMHSAWNFLAMIQTVLLVGRDVN
ncbi:MAG: CPBP family intramembrane glutamic endopeptidase [Pirellulales bacterium]